MVEAYFGHPHSELTIRMPDDAFLASPRPDPGPAGAFLDTEALVIPEEIVGRIIVLELPPRRQYTALDDWIGEEGMIWRLCRAQ